MSDPIRTFRHFRDVPQKLWRWPNFSPAEIACRGTGQIKLHPEALDKLQALRDRLGKPLIVRSAYRSPEHNRAVGGARASKHMDGTAFDIAMTNHDPVAFEAAAREVGFLGFGFYARSGFIHVDVGNARQWGERFPVRATAFAAGSAPACEVLTDSRTLKGVARQVSHCALTEIDASARTSWPKMQDLCHLHQNAQAGASNNAQDERILGSACRGTP